MIGHATHRPRPRHRRLLELGATLSILALVWAPAPEARAGGRQQRRVPNYPANVNAVALDVVVTDRRGRFVPGLKQDDFEVLEGGVTQKLSFFTASRTPVTVLVLLDSSASVRSNLLPVQKAASHFIKKLPKDDRARVGFFHDRVVFGPRFTDDMKEHSAMINQMRPQRSTHLYDALVESLDILDPIPDRKALLVFSDGEDQGSQTSLEGGLAAARRSLASVYAVGLMGWSTEGGMYTNQKLLEQIARFTGGSAFFPKNPKQMQKAFDRIREELHHQYRMGYVPDGDNGAPDGWREVEVKLTRRPELNVRSRLGYFRERQ